ncbi:hypothetical protein, partial [Pseudomonas sp. 2822-17]|uniref:hypothetical protein n=1 Tax=Pseudomonas sp. 2822-17 TaxID=1712678 RepID=UPI001C476612
VYFVISLTGISMLTVFSLLLLLAGTQMAVILTLNSYREDAQASIDPIYSMFITYAVFFIYLGITAEMILDTVISSLLRF